MLGLEFGVFDHLDDNGIPLAELFETRLKLTEQYDRAGFRSYHIAEHHSTPLGLAPSPSVFLAAVAQRTTRLRLGPLLYVTPMYHPLRVAEEVVMLDPMSRGRLELGLGRGASPIEIAGFDVDPAKAPDMNREATELILKALTSEVVTFEGKFYRCNNVRIEARPLQQPYPPLWFAPSEPSRAADAARLKGQIVTLVPDGGVKAVADAYRAEWKAQGGSDADIPRMAFSAMSSWRQPRTKRARPCVRPTGNGGTIWHSCGNGAVSPSPLAGSIPTNSTRSKECIWASRVRRKPCAVTLLKRSTGPASIISLPIWPSARFPYEVAARSVELFAKEVMPAFR
jgi:Luciferase-like monooxygenase